MKKELQSAEKQAYRVSIVSIIWNIALSVLKLAAGIIANSAAMISDAAHSASDVFSTVVVMIGIKISSKESDANHPYGHERFECVAAIILAIALAATGVGIGYGGLSTILSGSYGDIQTPGLLALIAAIVSIVVKELMYHYTRRTAKRIKSGALMADAWHHRSDALSSIGSFAGILGARLGYPVLDSVACLVICVFVVKAGFDIFVDAIKKLTDTACDESITRDIRDTVVSQAGVVGVDTLKTRIFGNRIYVDVEISAEATLTLREGHEIAEGVHNAIEQGFSDVKHCMVHVNPAIDAEGLR